MTPAPSARARRGGFKPDTGTATDHDDRLAEQLRLAPARYGQFVGHDSPSGRAIQMAITSTSAPFLDYTMVSTQLSVGAQLTSHIAT